MKLICIDPGISGALVIYDVHSKDITHFSCPSTIADMAQLIYGTGGPVIVAIEKVHCGLMSRIANFKLGQNFGEWRGICAALKIRLFEVTPQAWQKEFRGEGEERGWIQKRPRNSPVVKNPLNIKEVVWRLVHDQFPTVFGDQKKFIMNRSHVSDACGILVWALRNIPDIHV